MHPSTVAAILAFTAGMTTAAPALGPDLILSNTQPTKLRTSLGKARVDSNLGEFLDDDSSALPVAKRGPQNIGKGRNGEPVYFFNDVLTVSQKDSVEKRDPQRRGRLSRIGEAIDVGSGAIGLVNDGINLGKTIKGQPAQQAQQAQPAKRDPRSKFRNIGNAIEAGAGAIGVGADIISIGGAAQPAQHAKRDPQRRNKLGSIGKDVVAEVGPIEFRADVASIGGAVQGQPAQHTKRDPQRRGRLGRLGDAFEGAAGAIGFGADIIGATQPQPAQPAKRDPQRASFKSGGSVGCLAVVCTEFKKDDPCCPSVEKRDPQRRGRLGRLGDAFEGAAGAIGFGADIIGATQPQPAQPAKRDPRSKFRNIGNVIEGAAGAIGLVGDVSTIAGATQPQPAKRDPQRGRHSFPTMECAADIICFNGPGKPYSPCCVGDSVTKRDPRSKFRNIGNAIEAGAGAIGLGADAITIGGAVQGQPAQPAKRDPRSKFRNIGNVIEGAAGAIGLVGDVSTIAGAAQPQPAKRDPRSKFRNIGNVIEGAAGAIGLVGDVSAIAGAAQPQPAKRDPRSKFRNIGNALEGAAGLIGFAGDASTIAGAAQGQPAKRDSQHDDALIIGGAPAVHSGRPIDGNTLAKLSRDYQAEKRELEQGEADIADDTFEGMEQEEQEE